MQHERPFFSAESTLAEAKSPAFDTLRKHEEVSGLLAKRQEVYGFKPENEEVLRFLGVNNPGTGATLERTHFKVIMPLSLHYLGVWSVRCHVGKGQNPDPSGESECPCIETCMLQR